MPTAPSFSTYRTLSEPFAKNGKLYITVEHPNTKRHRDVRWYSDVEYAKAYKNLDPINHNTGIKNLKQIRGFSKGPIAIITNASVQDEVWLKASNARYALGIGWHFVSTDTLPQDLPAHFQFVLMSWNEFRYGDDEHMKPTAELAAIIKQKIAKKEFINFCGN